MTTTALTAALPLQPTAPRAARALADRVPGWALLALGFVATLLTGPRWGVAALAWIAPVPYLLYARRASGWRAWSALAAVLVLAYPLQLLTIVTDSVPPMMALFGLGHAVPMLLALLAAEWVRRRAGERVGIFTFASATMVLDWVMARHTEFGVWATTGISQVDSLVLLQMISITGMAGLGLLMGWTAALAASLAGTPAPAPIRRWPHVLVLATTFVAILQVGTLRLQHDAGRSVTVAAVVTDQGMTLDSAVLAANTETLFERTRLAAARGARLVVWNEVATLIEPTAEPAFLQRGRDQARALHIDLVLAYGVIERREPFLMQNKFVFVTSEGELAETYEKHHPVPGEPSVRGDRFAQVIDRPYGRVGGMICYDGDFPEMGLDAAAHGAELVVVPSSDWRGIDPVHTMMARTRAVEGGFAMLRSTRWGASAGFDAYGRVRGWMRPTEANDRVMVTTLPVGRVPTAYAAIGDWPVAGAGGFLVVGFALALRRRRRAAS